MISALRIKSFKRFEDHEFAFRPLTVLSGLNGAGKTSIIHSLLLLKAASGVQSSDTVSLNGPFEMELGEADDVRNWNSENGAIEFDLRFAESSACAWRFSVPSSNARYLTVEQKAAPAMAAFGDQPRSFTYLSAERLGPRSVLGTSASPIEKIEIGVKGEYCAQLLGVLGSKPLEHQDRLHPSHVGEGTPLLKYEVERWLAEIARPVEINAQDYPGAPVNSMQFRFSGGDWVKAPNMGFGVSYSLPIILGGLIAQPGGLLIVENPEAHLHPAGQSRMGAFLAWLAGRGVQVVVETHSDHVLNGIRRAIGEHEYIRHDAALVHFFDTAEDDQPRTQVLEFTAVGGISHWPDGFFDQYQIDVASLGRIRRRR